MNLLPETENLFEIHVVLEHNTPNNIKSVLRNGRNPLSPY